LARNYAEAGNQNPNQQEAVSSVFRSLSRNLGRKGESKDRKRSGFGVSCDELKAGLSLDTIPEEAASTLSFFG